MWWLVIPRMLPALAALALAACGTAPGAPAGSGPVCPTTPVSVVVSVDPWSDLVARLGGACARVTTILAGSGADPHEFEPSIGEAARMSGAQVAVVNGAGYDTWASKLLDTVDPPPVLVDAGAVVGAPEGSNPHLWYAPAYVHEVVAAVTRALVQALPEASGYFSARATEVATYLEPYDAAVRDLTTRATGRTYGATEGVYDLMAEALGLQDLTPEGWRQAAANDSDPSPGDVVAFQDALGSGAMDVLVRNVQAQGAASDLVVQAAADDAVPLVDVTETMPAGQTSFVRWQVGQLDRLAAAVGLG